MITDVRQISRDRCVGLDRAHRGADYAALAWGMVAECGMCAAKAAVKAKQTAVSAGDAQMALALDAVLARPTDSPLVGGVKNARTMMVWSFFALGKDPVTELPVYDDGTVRIEVTADKYGVATTYDKDVLIYVLSLIQDKLNRGETPSRIVSFKAHDFFVRTGRSSGGSYYNALDESLRRLKSTTIRTNIEIDDTVGGQRGEVVAFSWIDSSRFRYTRGEDGKRVADTVVVALNEWLYSLAIRQCAMLTYRDDYFDLKPLARRLYEIARAHCGAQPYIRFNLEKLRLRVGSTMSTSDFKSRLMALSKGQRFPLLDYGYMVVDPRKLAGAIPGLPPGQSRAVRRTPVKSYMVLFFRKDASFVTALGNLSAVPIIDADGFPSSSDLD
jgi:hypothetical protein